MKIILSFDFDEEVVSLYHQSINSEYTSEFRSHDVIPTLSIDQVRTRLEEIKKSEYKNGFLLHGILKVYINDKLAAISFPRKLIPSEYDKFDLKAIYVYHRISGIFVDPEFRGQGISLKVIEWFIDKFKFILWTADVNNHSSLRVAQKAKLNEIKEMDILNHNGEVSYRLKVFAN